MSPRSKEFMDGARQRLAAARTTLEAGHDFTSIGESYYAMLYAARAALSEEDRYAKSHSGTWRLFRETFVKTGRLPERVVVPVDGIRRRREEADYEAQNPTRQQTEDALEHAQRFLEAVEEMIAE